MLVVSIIAVLLSLLLPALSKTRYHAKVTVCGGVLRGLGHAMTTYATDFWGSYPMAAEPNTKWFEYDDWAYTDWPRSWALKENSFDTRPLYRQYLGGSLDKYMKCPMAADRFADHDIDTYVDSGRALTPYMLYPTNNANQKFFRFDFDDKRIVSSKLNQTWSPISHSELEFSYIASDIAFGNLAWQGDGAISGHPAPDGSYGQGGEWINSHPGHRLGTLDVAGLTAPVNFLDGDGAVHRFDMDNLSRFGTDVWITNNYRDNRYLIPRDLAH